MHRIDAALRLLAGSVIALACTGAIAGEPQETEQLKAEIRQTRVELAGTVDALHDRLNVKAVARQRAEAALARVTADPARTALVLGGVLFVLVVVRRARRG